AARIVSRALSLGRERSSKRLRNNYLSYSYRSTRLMGKINLSTASKPSRRPSRKWGGRSRHTPQLMQQRQIFILALLRLLRIAPESARHAAAMKRQLARKLIAAHPGAPHGKTLTHQNVTGHAHPTI